MFNIAKRRSVGPENGFSFFHGDARGGSSTPKMTRRSPWVHNVYHYHDKISDSNGNGRWRLRGIQDATVGTRGWIALVAGSLPKATCTPEDAEGEQRNR